MTGQTSLSDCRRGLEDAQKKRTELLGEIQTADQAQKPYLERCLEAVEKSIRQFDGMIESLLKDQHNEFGRDSSGNPAT